MTNIAFNICIPLLINTLGNEYFNNDSSGAIVYTYLTSISSIATAICFLTVTNILENFVMKRNMLIISAIIVSICLSLFIFCYNTSTLYFACALFVIAKISQSLANLSFEALLDDISYSLSISNKSKIMSNDGNNFKVDTATRSDNDVNVDTTIIPINSAKEQKNENQTQLNNTTMNNTHQISARSTITGYIGMISYVITVIPIIAAVYFTIKPSTSWIEGIIPNFFAGIWYFIFVIIVHRNLPYHLGRESISESHVLLRCSHKGEYNVENIHNKINETHLKEEESKENLHMQISESVRGHKKSDGDDIYCYRCQGVNKDCETETSNSQNSNTHSCSNKTIDIEKNKNESLTDEDDKYVFNGIKKTGISNENICIKLLRNIYKGFFIQIQIVKSLNNYVDLTFFIISYVFLAAANSTGNTNIYGINMEKFIISCFFFTLFNFFSYTFYLVFFLNI